MSKSFRILRELGSGGMATVYIAEQLSLKREVALKILDPNRATDPSFTDRFLREGRTVASLRHRHIVTVYDIGVLDGKPYISMEYLPLGSIASIAKQLSPPEIIRCIREIASALDYAHQHGIVHRDVKPENVLRHEDGAFLLSDFGIARVNSGDGAPTQEGQIFGTPAYMSPEQWRDEKPDGRADLYSLGIMLYQLLAGKVPYDGTDNWAVGMKHMTAPIPVLPVPYASLQGLLAKLLAKDRNDRFATGAEVVTQIESLEREGAIPSLRAAGPTTPIPKARTSRLLREWPHGAAAQYFEPESAPPSKARRKVIPAMAALLALAALGGILFWHPWHSSSEPNTPVVAERVPLPAASVAVLRFANLSQASDQEYFSDGLSEELLDLLTKIPGLHVAGRTSSFGFKGKNAGVADIGRALNVANVLQGSVQKSADGIHITAKLVKVADGAALWRESYVCQPSDMFTVQNEIAAKVTNALQVQPPTTQPSASISHRTSNADAYDQYLIGRESSGTGDPKRDARALEAYTNAIALDPKFAAAYAGLAAEEYNIADTTDNAARAEQYRQDALSAANQALQLDPELPEGYQARGLLRTLVSADWSGAQADFERALALAPGDSLTLRRYGILLATLGQLPEAIEVTRKSIALDPLSSAAWSNLGRYLLAVGSRRPEALQALTRAAQLAPESVYSNFTLGLGHMLDGNPAAALAVFQRIPAGHHLRLAGVAMAEFALDRKEQSQQALDTLLAASRPRPYSIAWVYMARGDRDQTFTWLDRAYAEHDSFVDTIKAEPYLVGMRDDPRYTALLKKIGLPP